MTRGIARLVVKLMLAIATAAAGCRAHTPTREKRVNNDDGPHTFHGLGMPAVFRHQLIVHDSSEAFGRGLCEDARLDQTGDAVVLTPTAERQATFESPGIETEIDFYEAVASWNVDTPADAGFCVEIRVGRRCDDSWTPYLYVGDWGDVLPPGEHVVSCDAGRIDVDAFRSDRLFDRVQYRIRAACDATCGSRLRIERVVVCVSDTAGASSGDRQERPQALPPPRETWPKRLPVPFRSQLASGPELAGRICSPTSLAMVLEYRGVNRPTAEIAAACYDPAHDIYGNWPRNIQAAYSLGVPGYLARFADWDDVRRLIADDQPLIVSIRFSGNARLTGAPYKTTQGHLLVLTGFDEDGNVYANDPAAATAAEGQLTYSRDELEQVWMRGSGGLAYVLLPAKRESGGATQGSMGLWPVEARTKALLAEQWHTDPRPKRQRGSMAPGHRAR